MAVTYGFYNALNHDRLYDAIQMSSIFDGIIRDGIFSTIGTAMIVTAPEDGMFVDVGPGRAWFNHTWTLNDTEYPVEAEAAEVVLDRIDAVVLEVNANPEVRANSIKFVKGTPSSTPVKPTMIHNAEVNQYALAYVTIRAGQTTIFQADIENVIGTDETPFVTGLLQQVSVEQLLLQWNDDFYRYFAAFQAHNNAEFNTWMEAKVAEYNNWYAAMELEGAHDLEVFDTWFQHMKDQLDEDAAGHLQAEIDELAEACEKGSVFTVTTEESELVGRSCVVSQGSDTVIKTFDANGVAEFPSMPYIGSIHVEATDGDNIAQGEMNIPYFGRYSMEIAFWAAVFNISTSADGLIGRPITITKGGVVVGTTSFNASGRATYKVHEPGTYIVSSSTAGGDEYATTVVVTEETAYAVNLGIPSGETATPTDDIQTWLKCASIYDKSYTLLADVLDDYYTCERLFSDSNACDYMARSSSWAAIVCTDASVMEQIVKYDYCKWTLTGNATWREALLNSDVWIGSIFEPLVPIMTSNTTPSGEASAASVNTGTGYPNNFMPYHAFNRVNSPMWASGSNAGVNCWLRYVFASPVTVYAATVLNGDRRTKTIQMYTSNDGSNWTDQTGPVTAVKSVHQKVIFEHPEEATRYEYVITGQNSTSGSFNVNQLQYYGLKDQPTVDVIHSAAYDTIYYYDANSVERQLCVTDENGIGTVDWSALEPGIYTFYSSVAKNPDNLAEEYSRTVKITRTTTEIYLMPVNALYWYGHEDANLEDCLAGTGWTGSFSYANPTHNANNIYLSAPSNQLCGVGTERILSTSKIQAVGHSESGNSAWLLSHISKDTSAPAESVSMLSAQDKLVTIGNLTADRYACVRAALGTNMVCSAFWHRTNREITLYSAANDTIYYLGENDVHIPIAKTDETGMVSVDLGLLPQGTYTLYSSVAKDPENLSNPYSKQVTIGPDTKRIKVMPDSALYWWGYGADGWEIASTANGWSIDVASNYWGVTLTNNETNMLVSSPTNKQGSIASKNTITGTYKVIAGTTAAYGNYPQAAYQNNDKIIKYNSGTTLTGIKQCTANALTTADISDTDKKIVITTFNGASIAVNAVYAD